jgi:hypothetical protein
MLRKRLLIMLITAVLIAAAAGCAEIAPTVLTGSGNPATRDFNLNGFDGVQAAATFNVQITRADSFQVRVTADDNLWDVLDISVAGNVLHLQTKPNTSIRNTTLKAVLTMPDLTSLDLSGAARAEASGFKSGSDLNLMISGASNLTLADVQYGSTALDISGGSKVTGSAILADSQVTVSGAGTLNLSGSGTNVNIDASGGGQVILDQFPVQKINVTLSGASLARVNTQEITRADLSGGAQLRYTGSPSLGKIQKSGGAALSPE